MNNKIDARTKKALCLVVVCRTLFGIAMTAMASEGAAAETTALICTFPDRPNACGHSEGPLKVEVDEANSSLSFFWSPMHTANQHYPAANWTVPAKFTPAQISFVYHQNETVVIDRVTGVFYLGGDTFTCHVGKAQF
jgi:hypothetical protein